MELKRYQVSNKKYSVILMVFVFLILLLVIFVLYRSYAVYQEQQEFNVMKGKVPNLDYDVQIAMNVRNTMSEVEYVSDMPEGVNWDVLVTCDHDATGSWNYDSWSLNVSNITQTKTRCNLTFTRPWVKFISYENEKYSYQSFQEFLNDSTEYQKVFSNPSAMQYLITRTDLIAELKSTPTYFDSEHVDMRSSTDIRSDLIKTIIESDALTNEEKYLNGLPCYIFKDGMSLIPFQYAQNITYPSTSQPTTFSHSINSSINLKTGALTGSCSTQSYRTKSKLNLASFSYTALRVNIVLSQGKNYSPAPGVGFGSDYSSTRGMYLIQTKFCGGSCHNDWTTSSIDRTEDYAIVSQNNCRSDYDGFGNTTLNLYEWYLF